MSWAVGEDSDGRDIGYGVPALCDHPRCNRPINRGLAYVCGGEPYGGDHGCGLFFCGDHLAFGPHAQNCPRCLAYKPPYKHPKPDVREWIQHKLTHESWERWRQENSETVANLRRQLNAAPVHGETDE